MRRDGRGGAKTRHSQREDRPGGAVPHSAAASVRLRDRVDDRETETDAARERGSARRPRARTARRFARAPPSGRRRHCLRPRSRRSPPPTHVLSSIASPRSVYLTAFSSSASSAMRSAFRVDRELPGRERAQPPRARGHLGPAHEDILEEGLEVDVLERRRSRAGRPSRAAATARGSARFVRARRVRRRSPAPLAVRAAKHLEMTARDRHRRAQLVRRVVQERSCRCEQRRALLGLTLDDARARPGAGERARPSRGTSPTSAAPRRARPRAGRR